MHKIEVDKPYLEGKSHYPNAVEFNFSKVGYELRLFFARPSKQEIQGIKRGAAKFEVLVEDKIIFLLYKFSPLDWGDAPYSWWALPVDYRIEPEEIGQREGVLLQTILIDSITGIVKAIRVKSLETELSQKLAAAIKEQMREEISDRDYGDRVRRAYAKYPSTLAMLKAA